MTITGPGDGQSSPEELDVHDDEKYEIQIDGKYYHVAQSVMTGAELRKVPDEPIGPERNLFEVVAGKPDKKVENEDKVQIRNGKRFLSAPAHVSVGYEIQIDRKHYHVTHDEMTGAELRKVPDEPIGPDRDLFEVVPGESDRKIELKTMVKITNGKRFFTAPAHINPGRS